MSGYCNAEDKASHSDMQVDPGITLQAAGNHVAMMNDVRAEGVAMVAAM